MRSLPIAFVLLVSFASLGACGDDSAPTDAGPLDAPLDVSSDSESSDAGASDAAASDATASDAAPTDASPTDASPTDASPTDASPTDASSTDASSTDASPTDGGVSDAGDDANRDAGSYIDDLYITDCATGYERVRRFFSTSEPESCPDYFVIAGERFPTLGEAIVSRSCVEACLRVPRNSFTILRCDRRTGYISFVDDEGCTPPSVIETPDGIFADADEWNAAFPCM